MIQVAIIGAGESGLGAAILASKLGYTVWLSDAGKIPLTTKERLNSLNVSWEEQTHTFNKIVSAKCIVKSPGVPDKSPLITKLTLAGKTPISELEFAAQHTQVPLVAVTGTNGKTTTTSWIAHILKQAGKNIATGGNIGDSFARLVAEENPELFVLEVSSFQLDGVTTFAPHIAVITNITPDHLDRYDHNFENYVASKLKITEAQTTADYLVFNADDPHITKALKQIKPKAQCIPFSTEKAFTPGAYIQNNKLVLHIQEKETIMDTIALGLPGTHNVQNAMAAATTAKLLQIRKDTIRASLENFQAVEHRLEPVLKINGVHYINDSKATNVNAAFYALNSLERPIIWIAGGVDKGNDYKTLLPLVNEKVKAIICLGLDNQKLKEAFSPVVDTIFEANSANEAVRMAYALSEKNDTVLLAPACASFDLFKDYEDRGRQFKEAVHNL